jgi:acetyl esterase/lipase
MEQTMRHNRISSTGALIVAFVMMLLLVGSQTRAQDGTFHETFDDPALSSWMNSPQVTVTDGALRIPASSAAIPPGTWENMTLTARLRKTEDGGLAINYHTSPAGAYILLIEDAQISLGREENGVMSPLDSASPLTIPANEWFGLTITIIGGEHRVDLNAATVLTVTEQNPLPAGGIAFETIHEAEAAIDEITITIGMSASPPAPAAASADLSGCETQDGYALCRDLQYADYGQDLTLGLDLYLPTNAESESLPILVYIHGGGWFEGSKSNCPGSTFVQHGYAVACVDYRLATAVCAPDTVFPAQMHDVKAAIRWLRQHADTYGYDADHMGAIGESSGGHLAALLGVSDGAADLEGTANPGASSAVQAVVDWYGPVDITQGPMVFEDDPCVAGIGALNDTYGGEAVPYFYWTYAWGVFLGGSLTDPATLEQAAQATPLSYIDANDPPFLIIHGEIDGMVPIEQSELLADALQAAGVDVTFIRLPNAGHGYWGPGEPVMSDFLTPTLQFLDTHLKNH